MPRLMTPQRPFGIVCSTDSDTFLPFEQVEAHAEIVDVSATVTLTQKFWQGSLTPAPRAKYVFPVPAHAAVCGFEMRTEDGRVVTAVVKEKDTARREHEQAIREGRMTGLVEQATDDVFTISLGALPSVQMITTKLTYVIDLMEDDYIDQVRLLLPVCIGSRYGQPPPGMMVAKIVPPERITIAVDVFMKGAIRGITSPSHPTTVLLEDGQLQIGGARSPRRKGARYASANFLTEDFVLCIKSDGLDTARCFAERSPAGSIAIQLTVVPKFNLPNIPEQEYIFIIDRSGSMFGSRIETAKRALVLLLRALPAMGTTFNIFSFGNLCHGLWAESREYSGQTLQEATAHVDFMQANYGGTRIRHALETVFAARSVSLPTSCFVLTDGNSYEINETIQTVAAAVIAARPGAPLRVFTLGIGESTSTAMCEGIARAGNGICLMAAAEEAIVAKCSKLVKASRSAIFRDVIIDWGAPADIGCETQGSGLRQGPSVLPILYAGCRFVVFALVQSKDSVVPKQVVIEAKHPGAGEVIKIPVEVEQLDAASSGDPQRPLIHTLAARRVIMDLEDPKTSTIPDRKGMIIDLGIRYQLASRYTSFIAVGDKLIDSGYERNQEPLIPYGPSVSTNPFLFRNLLQDPPSQVILPTESSSAQARSQRVPMGLESLSRLALPAAPSAVSTTFHGGLRPAEYHRLMLPRLARAPQPVEQEESDSPCDNVDADSDDDDEEWEEVAGPTSSDWRQALRPPTGMLFGSSSTVTGASATAYKDPGSAAVGLSTSLKDSNSAI